MKKSILVLTASTILILTSCGNSENKTEASKEVTPVTETVTEKSTPTSIVGTWKLASVDLGMQAPKGHEKEFENMIKEMIEKTSYSFLEDGTLNLSSVIGQETGTYKLEGENLTTVLKNKTETVKAQLPSANELVITVVDNGETMTMTFKK